ncbi:MAG: acyl-CoA synthetase [Actinomycetota bacterium]
MDRFEYEGIGFWVARRAELTGARVAIRHQGHDITYRDLDARTNRAAGALQTLGVGKGDRLAILAKNSPEYAEVFLACAKLGAIVVPLNWRLTPSEIEFQVNDSGAATLVYESEFSEAVDVFRPATGIKEALELGSTFEEALAGSGEEEPGVSIEGDDVLALIYTSGTTGRPKGAMLTHANFFWTNLNILLAIDITQDERSVMVLPMFHVGGWNVNTLSVWWKGGTVLVEREFDASGCLRLVEAERATSMMGVPAIYLAMTQAPEFESADLSSLRHVVCGGAPAPESLIRTWEERGVKFIQGYGLTEAAPNSLVLPPEDSRRKLGAAGRPYFYADVRVVGENDEPVGAGGKGEIVIRGPSIMPGYWELPLETAHALRGGWLRTGDVARLDDEGYAYIVDRVKDMIISGGENVYPAEIENVLYEHPAVAEAAVIGVPDEKWGEAPLAVIVTKPGEAVPAEDVLAFCRERLAKFKTPKRVEFVDALPRTPSGKVIKHELRDRFVS